MYISEISGHHSATLAIEKAIKLLAPETEVLNINAFNYTNPIVEKIVNRLYMGIIKRTPKIWDFLYDNPKIVKKVAKIKETIHKANTPKLKALFDRFRPDAVVCTQAFPCGMVADFKTAYNSNIPLLAVLTDYIPHSYWIYETVNYYIVPAEDVAARLIKKGVKSSKVKPLGIPFDPKFNESICRETILSKLGFDPYLPIVLIMGGGQGLGPIKGIVKSLENAKSDFQEIVVSGTNMRLNRVLKRTAKKCKKQIRRFGYVHNINEFMAVSDIVITKPGGITTAEALSMKLPMIIIKPLPGQEINNTEFLIGKNAAIKIDKTKEISSVIDDLLVNRNKLKRLSNSAGRISKPNASLDIARLLLNLK
jgi:processive 1,2-diacylglycerol beta-glucosyltransferase